MNEIDTTVVEKLETSEGLEVDFELRRQELKTQLVRDETSVINLTRTYVTGSLGIDFNFHFEINNKEEIVAAIEGGVIESCRAQAEEMLEKYYDVAEVGVESFDLQDTA